MSSPLVIINPTDRDYYTHRYVLSFGAYACTHLMVYASSLDDALEECAEWVTDNAPGHIMAHDSDELVELFEEARAELFGDTQATELSDEQRWECEEQATADLTYTESGYITSYEWTITLEDPSRAEIKAFIASLAERHYSDEPVVAVAC